MIRVKFSEETEFCRPAVDRILIHGICRGSDPFEVIPFDGESATKTAQPSPDPGFGRRGVN